MEIGPDTIVSRRGRPYVEETDEGLVVEPEPGRYVRLNGAAALLWRELGRPVAVRELAARLVTTFGIGDERALEDAAAFLRTLHARGLVDTLAPAGDRARPAHAAQGRATAEGGAKGSPPPR